MTEKNIPNIYNNKNIIVKNNSKRLVFELDDESDNNSEDELEKNFNLQINKNLNKINSNNIIKNTIKNNINKNDNQNLNIPKNYGNKWTDEDRNLLISMLKKKKNNDIIINSYNNDVELKGLYISEIANKLGRTDGGIKSEINKIIYNMYMNGSDAEKIAKDLNFTYKSVKSVIKIFIDKESEQEIKLLEKENKLLKLRIENLNLRQELKIKINN